MHAPEKSSLLNHLDIFCRVHATLQPALSVPLSVRQSVGQTFFLLIFVILFKSDQKMLQEAIYMK